MSDSHRILRKDCHSIEAYEVAERAEEVANKESTSFNAHAFDFLTSPDVRDLPGAEKQALWQVYYHVDESLDQLSDYATRKKNEIQEKSHCFDYADLFSEQSLCSVNHTPEHDRQMTEWFKYRANQPPTIWERNEDAYSQILNKVKK